MPYKTLSQLQSAFHSLVVAHPSQAYEESIGKSYLGKDIMVYSFGAPTGGRVVWQASIHGRECLNPEILLQYAQWLFGGSVEANRILERNLTTIIPVFNVDGYLVRRKNSHDYFPAETCPSGTNGKGVDLNRNFQAGFGTDGHTGIFSPCSFNYQGFSTTPTYKPSWSLSLAEPEIKAWRSYIQSKLPAWFVDLHTGQSTIGYQSGDNVAYNLIGQFLTQDATAGYPTSTGVSYTNGVLDIRGMAANDAHALGCQHIMLWETHPTENTDTGGPAQETVASIWFPRFLPMAQSVSVNVEVIPPEKVMLTIESVAHGTTEPPSSTTEYATGTSIEIRAYPDAGMRLDHWLINGNDGGNSNPLLLTLNADTTVEAVFSEIPPDGNILPLLLVVSMGLATFYIAKTIIRHW